MIRVLLIIVISLCTFTAVAAPPLPGPTTTPQQTLTLSVSVVPQFTFAGSEVDIHVWVDYGEGDVWVYLAGPNHSTLWGVPTWEVNVWKKATDVFESPTNRKVASFKTCGCGWYTVYAYLSEWLHS